MSSISRFSWTLVAAAGLTLVAHSALAGKGATATATIESKSGSTATGTATFTEGKSGVKVVVHVEKATPGMHGLHIHEKGDCSDPEAKSAGGHFNPATTEHGGPRDAHHHAGDLGNIEVKADGTGRLELTTKMLTVAPGPNSVIDRSIVLHEKADDFKTQPTGNSGARIGCGVIK